MNNFSLRTTFTLVVESSTFERLLVLMISRFIFTLCGVLFIWFFLTESGGARAQSVVFDAVPASVTGIDFDNEFILPDSIDRNGFLYLWNGGGVAIGDLNNDGLQDIFFTGNSVPNRLYINKDSLRFAEASNLLTDNPKGWSTGVTLVDINADGWLDIYVCRSQIGSYQCKNLLYINQKGQGFKEKAESYGLDVEDNCTQATFFDADNDGDLDVFIVTYPKEGMQYALYMKKYNGGANHLLINQNGKYTPSKRIQTNPGFGLGVVSADFNRDAITDLYIANDLLSLDNYYLGPVTKQVDVLPEYFNHVSFNSMGVDAGDINNDGLLDLITLDMMPLDPVRRHMQSFVSVDYQRMLQRGGYYKQYVRNMLQLNTGSGFVDVSESYGIAKTDWSWSPLIMDFNNDGKLDLFVSNSLKKDFLDKDFSMFVVDTLTRFDKANQKKRVYKEVTMGLPEFRLKNRAYSGTGQEFNDISDLIWSGKKVNTTGCAYGDLDNDGDLDLVLNNLDTMSMILENTWSESGEGGHFIRIKPLTKKEGTLVYNTAVYKYGQEQTSVYQLLNSRGFQSCSEPVIHIGIADGEVVDSLVVIWPGGGYNSIVPNRLDTTMTLFLSDSKTNPKQLPKVLFEEDTEFMKPAKKHLENSFDDFKKDPILHKRLSRTGPGLAIGDVNGDDLNDIFLCGSQGTVGQLLLTTDKGVLFPSSIQPWQKSTGFEESAAIFLDVDNDKDNDLILLGGGYEHSSGSRWYWDRVYLNNGKAFFKETASLPKIARSKSCIASSDYDGDGDLDLFIGERYVPEMYPSNASGHILMNRNGIFEDVSAQIAPELDSIGMITSCLWTDFDDDSDMDLLVVGEWMPVCLFENQQGMFTKKVLKSDGLAQHGWWNVVSGADLDNDGDTDYLVGNVGTNLIVKGSHEEPCKLYFPYLNTDSRPDPVLTFWQNGVHTIFAMRDKMLDQVPASRKKYVSYSDYALAPIDSVVGSNSPFKTANEFRSMILINDGDGNFTWKPLNPEFQQFPIFDFSIVDLNKDGILDIIAVGNDFSYSNEIGNLDAGGVRAAFGQGNGTFEPVPFDQLGVNLSTDIKAIGLVSKEEENPTWIVSSNNASYSTITLSLPSPFLNRELSKMELKAIMGKRKIEKYLGGALSNENN
jgi:hypothetical protein